MSEKLITIEELEKIVSDNKRAWKLFDETGQGPEPEFPELSGLFDPSCFVEAARACEDKYPWLPDLLKNSGTGKWKYNGFVVFIDGSNEADFPDLDSLYRGIICLKHKGLGTVLLSISDGHIYDIEITEMLY